MWETIGERAAMCAAYIIQTGGTVRSAAAKFGVSKSTVHKDISERLPKCDPLLYRQVREVLDKNLRERHLRGGIATKARYERLQAERKKNMQKS